eukprot:TRINITY_DN3534_c0_g1_i1.p1 TRINITY_DN3534_c0_g1~~TRINITY_DN3534_c0_g1_i1.p1  ORF type:complete len:682 (+),score=70.27 TRINITY_DN3534_c0_g1_i1:21-2066(+)
MMDPDSEKEKDKGHHFRLCTLKKPTWCFQCKHFIWGFKDQAFKCKVCKIIAHKGHCVSEVDRNTSCAFFLHQPVSPKKNSKSRLLMLSERQRVDCLKVFCEKMEEDDVVEPHRVDTFLSILGSLPPEHATDEVFACFHGKSTQENSQQKTNQGLRYTKSTSDVTTVTTTTTTTTNNNNDNQKQDIDVWTYISHSLDMTDSLHEKMCILKVLNELSFADSNRTKIIAHGLHDQLINSLVYSGNPKTDFPPYALFYSIIKIFRNLCKDRSTMKKFVANDLLGKFMIFLKAVKQIKDNRSPALRSELLTMRMEGALLMGDYYKEFYDKDIDITMYICSRAGLDFIIEASQKNKLQIYNKITQDELEGLTPENVVYSSEISKVYKAKWKGIEVAVKFLKLVSDKDVKKEVTLLTLIKHPNICPFYGAFISEETSFVVTHFYPKGSLQVVIDRQAAQRAKAKEGKKEDPQELPVDTSLIVNMAMNAANGIEYLHTRKIIHRDIKAGNFLIDEHYNVYVIDFGVSRVKPDDPNEKLTVTGTPTWMAPEVADARPYDNKADSYSFALVLWQLVTGKSPYANLDATNFTFQISNQKYREKIPTDIDPTIQKLIADGWDPDPNKRPDMTEILNILYNMKNPSNGFYYCRVHEHVPDVVMMKLVSYLTPESVKSLSITSKRFYKLLCKPKS